VKGIEALKVEGECTLEYKQEEERFVVAPRLERRRPAKASYSNDRKAIGGSGNARIPAIEAF
jgi:hypothetical protein